MTWNYKVNNRNDNETMTEESYLEESYLEEIFPEISPRIAGIKEAIKEFRQKVKLHDPTEIILEDGIVLHWKECEVMVVCMHPSQMVWISVRTGKTLQEWKAIKIIRRWYHKSIHTETEIETEPEDPMDETGQEDNHWLNER